MLSDLGTGATADIVAGLDFVIGWHAERGALGSVVSMSLGGSRSALLDEAVLAVYNAGITVVATAGNSVRPFRLADF